MTLNNHQELIKQIISLTNYARGMYGSDHPSQGQWVVTGPQSSNNIEKRVGFCVQVRKGCGQFGSDLVFLRHADESLTTHENQAYFAMSQEQIDLARQIFIDTPENEDYSFGYKCTGKINQIGFLIESSNSKPCSAVSSVGLAITDSKKPASKTFISFV